MPSANDRDARPVVIVAAGLLTRSTPATHPFREGVRRPLRTER